jgi:hypothetical protein
MSKLKKVVILLTLAIICVTTPSCNVMEGLHQFNPNYKNPVIFSDAWWNRKKEQKENNDKR